MYRRGGDEPARHAVLLSAGLLRTRLQHQVAQGRQGHPVWTLHQKVRKKDKTIFIYTATDSVADPDPGSGVFMTPGSGIWDGKKTRSGSGMNIPDHVFEI